MTDTKKILIDSTPLSAGHAVRGIGTNTKELIRAITNNKNTQVEITVGETKNMDLSKYDVVHFTSFNPFFVSIPFSKPHGIKFVLTIHDLIQLIYPKVFKPGIKGFLRLWINKFLVKTNIDTIVTISETSKKDICRFFGIAPEKVRVIYLAANPGSRKYANLDETLHKYGLPKSFVLYVGDVNFNKNIPNLIKACRIAKKNLVIVGENAKGVEKLDLNHPELKHLKNIDWEGVIRLGFVSEEDRSAIYKLADCYVQPSYYEGFGLPVLESLSFGTPVVAARTQALVEIAEGAAVFVDPNDPEDIAKGFNKLIKNPKLPRVYSWEKAAKETIYLYETV